MSSDYGHSNITLRHVETGKAVSSMSTFIMPNSISEIRKKIDIDTKNTQRHLSRRSLIPVRSERRFCLDEYFYFVQFNSTEYTIEGVVV